MLISIRTYINDREHVVAEQTVLLFDVYDKNGNYVKSKTTELSSIDLEWLMAIYETLSGDKITSTEP